MLVLALAWSWLGALFTSASPALRYRPGGLSARRRTLRVRVAAAGLVGVCRLVTGVHPGATGAPTLGARVYFANHSTHLDARSCGRPCRRGFARGRTRWRRATIRTIGAEGLAGHRGVRCRPGGAHGEPAPTGGRWSLCWPRSTGARPSSFSQRAPVATGPRFSPESPGLYSPGCYRPDLELVPVHLQNLNRVLPKGTVLPVPLLGGARFGTPLRLGDGETKAELLEGEGAHWTRWEISGFGLYGHLASWAEYAGAARRERAGHGFARRVLTEGGRVMVANLNARIRAWWVMCVFAVALTGGNWLGDPVRPDVLSRPARVHHPDPDPPGRPRTLFWAFFVFVPLQYVLVALQLVRALRHPDPRLCVSVRAGAQRHGRRYGGLSGAHRQDPVGADGLRLLRQPRAGAAHARDPGLRGPERQAAVLPGGGGAAERRAPVRLRQALGRRPIAPCSAPTRRRKASSVVCSPLAIGAALWWATPFSPWQAVPARPLGNPGRLCRGLFMSAIKRDRGIKDIGTIEGHGGMLDRIDSLRFAAPVFFHAVRYWWT